MANWNPKRDPEPDKKDATRFKDFIKQKYIDKRFSEDAGKEDSDSSDDEQRKARKLAKKEKKKKAAKKVESEESEEIVIP